MCGRGTPAPRLAAPSDSLEQAEAKARRRSARREYPGVAELAQVFRAQGHERVIGVEEHSARDCVGPAGNTAPRPPASPGSLADDAEIVECVCEIRMHRTGADLLQLDREPEMLLGRDVVAGARRLFRGVRQGLKIWRSGHATTSLALYYTVRAPRPDEEIREVTMSTRTFLLLIVCASIVAMARAQATAPATRQPDARCADVNVLTAERNDPPAGSCCSTARAPPAGMATTSRTRRHGSSTTAP